jgi:hypothetical protein
VVGENAMLKLTPMRLFIVLVLVTFGLALGLPPDPHAVQQLHTSATDYRLAIAALLIPYAVIWYLSFYAFAKLQEYSKPLRDTKDGSAFYKISIGLGAIAFSLVFPTTMSLILNDIASHHASFSAAATIINNYLGLFPGLISFLLLYNGTRSLLKTAKGSIEKLDLRWHIPWFIVFSVVFSHLTIANSGHGHPYHLSLWLLVLTFIAPYIYGWSLGLLSAYDLNLYARTTPGSLYRQAIKRFAVGIGIVIMASIAIQFLNVTIAQRVDKSLGAVLLIDYVLLIMVAAGLGLVALGTKRLKKIEEI